MTDFSNQLPVIVLGAGGHARVLVDALLLGRVPVLGLSSLEPRLNDSVFGIPVLCSDYEIEYRFSPNQVQLVNGVGSTGTAEARRKLFERFFQLGFRFGNVIHPSAIVGKDVILGAGVQLMAGCIVQAGTRIGNNVIVNTRASIDHDCEIEDHVHIAPGAVLCGNVKVGVGSHIGAGATIVQNVRIEANSLIRAGSTATESRIAKADIDTRTELSMK